MDDDKALLDDLSAHYQQLLQAWKSSIKECQSIKEAWKQADARLREDLYVVMLFSEFMGWGDISLEQAYMRVEEWVGAANPIVDTNEEVEK